MKILNITITTDPKQKIIEKVTSAIDSKEKFVIFTPNPEMITFATRSDNFRRILNSADINLPDGVGLKIACNLKRLFSVFSSMNYEPITVTHGIDFMLDLCREAEKNNWSVGILGGKDNIAEKTGKTLLALFPKLKITYIFGDFLYNANGKIDVNPFGENPPQSGANSIRENPSESKQSIPQPTSRLDLLFVGLGTPKEQVWINQNKDSFSATVFMEVGGSFDVLGGSLRRAPKIMRRIGLEWLFRLFQEPKRIFRQLNLVKFIWLVLTTKNSIED